MQCMFMFHSLIRAQLQLHDDGEKKSVCKQMRGLGHCVYCMTDLYGNSVKTAHEW